MSTGMKIVGLAAVIAIAGGAYFAMTQNGTARENALLSTATDVVASATESGSGVVLAIVNGEKITKKQVTDVLGQMPQQMDVKDIYPMIVEQMVGEKLIDGAIAKSDLESEKGFQERVDALKKQVKREYFIEKMVTSKVTEADLKKEYEKISKENEGKQEVHARHILVSTEAEAKQVIVDLEKGANFEELAKKRSSGPSAASGGDLGYFIEEEMVPEFSQAAFTLKEGAYTKTPVKSQFGWHIIKSEGKRPRAVPKFAEVEGNLRRQLNQQAFTKLMQDLRSEADVKLFDLDGKPMASAAEALAPAGGEKKEETEAN